MQRIDRPSLVQPSSFEPLEPRTLLCAAHLLPQQHPVELRPDLLRAAVKKAGAAKGTTLLGNGGTLNSGPGANADIVWINRATTTTGGAADTDGFGNVFGASAPLARAVVDAVIVSYERMIGSFNYGDGSNTYNLTVSMGGTGNGAGANLGTTLAGKPKSGSISMGSGTDGHGAGWFVDPTPFESSEFMGAITNAFSGDAQADSPAAGLGDFFTVVAAEMTHCMGLFGSALPGWAALTTNTGIADTAEAGSTNTSGGRGTFWVFRGPSIKHLMTSNNGGSGGSNFGSAVHSAGPGGSNQPLTFAGDTYIGAQDQGNAVYEFGRRYLVNNTFALMFKDAYAYSSIDPAQFGTFYSAINETTKVLTVRGGDFAPGMGNSNDTISVTRSGNTITVSVDAGNDVPGTGALPGVGNLPAFVTTYDISQISAITIDASDGNDAITIGSNIGVPISVQGGSGANSLAIVGSTAADTITVNSGTVVTDAETITLAGGISSLAVDGAGSSDTINVQDNPTGLAFVTVADSAGNDTVNVNTDNTGNATAQFNSSMTLSSLSLGNGGLANLAANGNYLLDTAGLSMNGSGTLDLADNDLLLSPGTLSWVLSKINSGRAGGAWTGSGITSTSAKNNAAHNTTLGAMTGADFQSVNGPNFAGQAVASGDVVVKYTYYGDTDFNGRVNFDDYVRTDSGFNNHRTGWTNGDFDNSGQINFDDYVLIDLGFNTQSGTL